MTSSFLQHLQLAISRFNNQPASVMDCRQVFGGDITATYIVTTPEARYFLKLNRHAGMLLKEMEGLQFLRTANTSLKIPEPLFHGTFEQQGYLLMEHLEKGAATEKLWEQLAAGLVQLHTTTLPYFGLDNNNYIGTIVQNNTCAATWAEFYAQQRILPLVKKAYDQGTCTKEDARLAQQFCNKLPQRIPEEPPALLHGDLWSGNRMFTISGEAAVYDPAVYFGHREMDIAMTLLFGGFDAHFYTTYNEIFPLQNGWQGRLAMCQLYPLLVHHLLFGGHYYNSVMHIIKQFA